MITIIISIVLMILMMSIKLWWNVTTYIYSCTTNNFEILVLHLNIFDFMLL